MGRREERMSVEALARASGVKAEEIRFYRRQGLLSGAGRARLAKGAPHVEFIRVARRLGFSPAEIAELLRLEREMRCQDARVLVSRKLDQIRGRNEDIERMVQAVTRLAESCVCERERLSCPLIDALLSGEEPAG
ncbi:MAG: hypothetical protein AUK49_11965 [Betaproteobacteria bacterium CG2_30_68_42]|nr:MAG: hypothetical protein AUK49_11965 [Betaproteobacteria bacterium CG2_30_68_42]